MFQKTRVVFGKSQKMKENKKEIKKMTYVKQMERKRGPSSHYFSHGFPSLTPPYWERLLSEFFFSFFGRIWNPLPNPFPHFFFFFPLSYQTTMGTKILPFAPPFVSPSTFPPTKQALTIIEVINYQYKKFIDINS